MKIRLLFIFLSYVCVLHAQSVMVQGVVYNEDKNPVIRAVVKIKDARYEYLLHTNEEGIFSKKIYASSQTITISIAKEGYYPYENKSLSITKNLSFTLRKNSKEIETIVVKKGVIHKGDSTIFNADYYSNKKENKISDLLKKLPGVDVDREGSVTINGKKIDKVLVENETFFSGSTSMAVKSLPADVVDKFEFIENFKESAILGSGRESNVLNIKLKEDKKNIVFGDIIMHGNTKDRYRVGDNLFYYSPNWKASLINDFNNTNESIFGMMDYINFSGGIDRILKDPAAFTNNINFSDIIDLMRASDKFAHRQLLNAGNVHVPIWKDRYKISVFNINKYSDSKEIRENSMSFSDNLLSFFKRKENIEKINVQRNNIFSLNISNIEKAKVDVNYAMYLKNNNGNNNEEKQIDFVGTTNFNNSSSSGYNQVFNQVIDLSYEINEQHAQGISASASFSENQANMANHADNSMFFLPIFKLGRGENILVQNRDNHNNVLKMKFQHQFTFWGFHKAKLNAGINKTVEKQSIEYIINNIDRNEFSTQMQLNTITYNMGGEYIYNKRGLFLSAGVDALAIDNNFRSKLNENQQKLFYWLPQSTIKYKKNAIGEFSLRYRHAINPLQMYYFYTGDYVKTVYSAFKGISKPQYPLHERITFSYTKKSDYDDYYIGLKLNNTRLLKDYISDTRSTSLQNTSTIIFRENIGDKQELDLRLEKQFLRKKISVIAQPMLSKEKRKSIINSVDTYIVTKNFMLNTSIKSRSKGNYNFEVFNIYRTLSFKNNINENKMQLNEFGAEINANISDFFGLSTRFSFSHDLINKTKFSESKLMAEYIPNSSLRFNFSVFNLFSSKEKITMNNDDLFSYIQKIRQMPRFFYVGVVYKL